MPYKLEEEFCMCKTCSTGSGRREYKTYKCEACIPGPVRRECEGYRCKACMTGSGWMEYTTYKCKMYDGDLGLENTRLTSVSCMTGSGIRE